MWIFNTCDPGDKSRRRCISRLGGPVPGVQFGKNILRGPASRVKMQKNVVCVLSVLSHVESGEEILAFLRALYNNKKENLNEYNIVMHPNTYDNVRYKIVETVGSETEVGGRRLKLKSS